jgi:ribosomal protein S6
MYSKFIFEVHHQFAQLFINYKDTIFARKSQINFENPGMRILIKLKQIYGDKNGIYYWLFLESAAKNMLELLRRNKNSEYIIKIFKSNHYIDIGFKQYRLI